jgi:hypothetical protein
VDTQLGLTGRIYPSRDLEDPAEMLTALIERKELFQRWRNADHTLFQRLFKQDQQLF